LNLIEVILAQGSSSDHRGVALACGGCLPMITAMPTCQFFCVEQTDGNDTKSFFFFHNRKSGPAIGA
jgi:hypothetical protein